jgi:hypothetical protein
VKTLPPSRSTTQLVRSLYPQFAQMRGGHFMQQDAQEFWACVVRSLQEALPKIPGHTANPIETFFYGALEAKFVWIRLWRALRS